ncbi:MAG TPA: hypothetical protein VLX92_06715 [Kofleriaceae bacterium]|nr:hypothetical protein [Kofleriaceae bacterium]
MPRDRDDAVGRLEYALELALIAAAERACDDAIQVDAYAALAARESVADRPSPRPAPLHH